MTALNLLNYPSTAFCLRFDPSSDPLDLIELAESIYEMACRTDFGSPGFCLVDCGQHVESTTLRRIMFALKDQLALIHREKRNRDLVYLSIRGTLRPASHDETPPRRRTGRVLLDARV